MEPTVVRRRDACKLLGCGTFKLDQLIRGGELQAVKSGKALLIKVASINEYLSKLPPATLKPYERRKSNG
jgi:excisionase family DNA binding protein